LGDPLAIIWRLVLVSALLAALMALVTAYLAPDPDTVARGNREITIGLGIAYFASYWLWVRKAQAEAVPRGQQAGPIMLLLVVSLFLSLTPLFAPLLGVADQDWATRAWEAERAWVATLGVAAALVLYLRATRAQGGPS
jgi:hypothetical protein